MSVDASAGRIPAVSTLAFKRETGLSWTEEGAGAADAIIAELNVTRPDVDPHPPVHALHHRAARRRGASGTRPLRLRRDLQPVEGRPDRHRRRHRLRHRRLRRARAGAFAGPSIVDATSLDGQITLSYSGQRPGL